MKRARLLVCLLSTAVPIVLVGCGSGASAIGSTLLYAAKAPLSTPLPALDPSFQYIRVRHEGRDAFLARGYAEATQHGFREVYYSAERETLTLLDGRLVGFSSNSMSTRVDSSGAPPIWPSLVEDMPLTPVRYARQSSRLPNGPLAVREEVEVLRLKPSSVRAKVEAKDALVWAREVFHPVGGATGQSMDSYASDYAYLANGLSQATKKNRVEAAPLPIYSRQCISPTFCIEIEPWPAR